MKNNKFLQLISTKFIVITLLIVIVILIAFYWYILACTNTNIDFINKVVDSLFKLFAIIFAFIWFLNRYYIERKDIHKFDIKLDYNSIPLDSGNILLIYRVDLFNKGNSLFHNYYYSLQIDGFREKDEKIVVEKIQKLPNTKEDYGLPIEPNSWTALNSEKIINPSYIAIRFYYEIKKYDEVIWIWHKTYEITNIIK